MDIIIKPFNDDWTYNLVGPAAPLPMNTENCIHYGKIEIKIPTKLIKCKDQINVTALDGMNSIVEFLSIHSFIYETNKLGEKLLPKNTESSLKSLIRSITSDDLFIEFNIVESFN